MLVDLARSTVGTLTVAVAPDILIVLIGWCVTRVFFNGLLAAQSAVLPDQVPVVQRGLVSGILGVCTPVASVAGTDLVQAVDGHELAMFLVPCAVGGAPVLMFAARLRDRRLDPSPASVVTTRAARIALRQPPTDFAWAFISRFMLVMGFAFLVTYQAYYLTEQPGSTKSDAPHQIYLGTRTWPSTSPSSSTSSLERAAPKELGVLNIASALPGVARRLARCIGFSERIVSGAADLSSANPAAGGEPISGMSE